MSKTNDWGCILPAVCLVVLILGGMYLANQYEANRADRLDAEAETIRARTDLEAQRAVNWEHSFMLWSIALRSYSADVMLFGALLIVVAIAWAGLIRDLTRPQ